MEYSLSEIGVKFGPVLSELARWGNEYIAYMKQEKQKVSQQSEAE